MASRGDTWPVTLSLALDVEDVSSRVTVAIAPRGTGCELTLTHEGILPEFAERTEAGWTAILGNLASLLSGAPEA